MDHVLNRTPYHASRSGVSTAADRHDAWKRTTVGRNAFLGLLDILIVSSQVLGPVFPGLLWVNLKDFLNKSFSFVAC